MYIYICIYVIVILCYIISYHIVSVYILSYSNLFILLINNVPPMMDVLYQILILGSSSKVVLASPRWGVLIAIRISSL